MLCISYNLYKYIQRLSLLIFKKKKKKRSGGFLLHRCKVKRSGFGKLGRERCKSFFNVCFCDVRVWKNGFLYTNGAPYHVDQLGGQPRCGGGGVGVENVLSLPGWGGGKKLPPGGQCATVKSSLQSIHIAEVHFDFIKIRYNWRQRSLKPVILAPQLGGGTG